MKRAAILFAIAGFLLLACCAFFYIQASQYQNAQKRRFAAHSEPLREAPIDPPGALAQTSPKRGDPVAFLAIPRLGLSAVVLEGAAPPELKLGPGHIPPTPLPGEGGNFSVAGHRDTFFRPLRSIRNNDVIEVESRGRKFRYRVTSTRIVNPKDIHVLESVGRDTLTLVTCYPFEFLGSAPQRFIVHADCDNCAGRLAGTQPSAMPPQSGISTDAVE